MREVGFAGQYVEWIHTDEMCIVLRGIIAVMTSATAELFRATTSFSYAFSHWFPTPQLLSARAAGVDISDSSIKWILLNPEGVGEQVQSFGEELLPEGVVVNGAIQDVAALSSVLGRVKEKFGGVHAAHASLPEEAAYVFNMQVPPRASREQILSLIEFELPDRVPLSAGSAVYDYDFIDQNGEEIGVVVFSKEFTQKYVEVFSHAGLALISLELEARSIARAICADQLHDNVVMLVDFGRARSGIAILKHGVPIFSSTVGIGGEAIAVRIMKKLSITREEAQTFVDEEGLFADGGEKTSALEIVVGGASAFADELARHYHYWDTRRNDKGERMSPVGRVLLVGGSANMKGIADYIATHLKAPTEIPNVWQGVAPADDYIPPIDRKTSLQYATAIGLALRSR